MWEGKEQKAPGTIVPERNRIKHVSGKYIFPIAFCAVLPGCFAAGTFCSTLISLVYLPTKPHIYRSFM